MNTNSNSILQVFPPSTIINAQGHLVIGGCDAVDLARSYGTPLYIFDETGIRDRCAEFKDEFSSRYPEVSVLYACKAFTCLAMLRLIAEEGLGLDVVSGGELEYAHVCDFPMKRISFPGNNKSAAELDLAILSGIGQIVVDNLPELDMLGRLAGNRTVDILLRLSPGIDPHTHRYNSTGTVDSKFGLTRPTWDQALRTAQTTATLNPLGFHFHLGSGLFETEPYLEAIDIVLDYAMEVRRKFDFEMKFLSIGGGYGVKYHPEDEPPAIAEFAQAITSRIRERCAALDLPLPHLIVEPGRSIVAQYGVALYTIGTIKEIPEIRTYVAIDGGMGDNIRFPLYGFIQEALLANRAASPPDNKVTVTGRYCESGDILIPELNLPEVQAGDILAVAGSGAYAVPMASNYNSNYRPAIIFVRDGQARLVRRRETFDDLVGRDI